MTTTIKTNDADGSVKLCPTGATPEKGWTIRAVDASTLTPQPADQPTAQEKWVNGGVQWVVPTPTPQQTFDAAVAAGYTVPDITPPLVLDLGDGARAQFTGLVVLLDKLMTSGQLLATSTQAIADKSGALHMLPVSQIESILLGYGAYYAGLYNTLHAAMTASAS